MYWRKVYENMVRIESLREVYCYQGAETCTWKAWIATKIIHVPE